MTAVRGKKLLEYLTVLDTSGIDTVLRGGTPVQQSSVNASDQVR